MQTFHALGSVKRRHQGADDTSPPGRVAAERAVVGRVDRVIATCTDEVFELARLGAPRRRTTVVPCGVDTAAFSPDGPVHPRAERPRIVVLGRLVRRKGVDEVIAALRRLPGVELLVAGGPDGSGEHSAALHRDPDARRLRQAAAAAGVADRVRLLGAVARPDVPALLRSADAVVCVPWYEPFGIVPLEAMACGRPVVASAVGGIQDTVVDQVTGPARAPAPARRGGGRAADAARRRRPGHSRSASPAGTACWPATAGTASRTARRRVRGGARRAGGQARTGPGGRASGGAGRLPGDDSAVLGVAR